MLKMSYNSLLRASKFRVLLRSTARTVLAPKYGKTSAFMYSLVVTITGWGTDPT